MKGRKRKPAALRAIDGGVQHRSKAEIAANNGPGFTPTLYPDAPAHFAGLALEKWKMLTEEFSGLGLLKRPTPMALEGACIAYSQAVEADKALIEKGLTVETYADKDGELFCTGIKTRPEVKISHDAWGRFLRFCTEFGMTPASEGKVGGARDSVMESADAAMFG